MKKDHVEKNEFIPCHKEFNKKVLKFILYFKETVYESPLEHYRVRIVDLYYYLEVKQLLNLHKIFERYLFLCNGNLLNIRNQRFAYIIIVKISDWFVQKNIEGE